MNLIFEDSKNVLWFATNLGLVRFDYKMDSVLVYNQNDGLPSNYISGILEDKQGNLWVSTKNGISQFDIKNKKFKNYDIEDGLKSNFFTTACFKDVDGTMYFGGVYGFDVFHPDSIKKNTFVPPVVLTDLKLFKESVTIGKEINGRVLLPQSISSLKEIELKYNESMITFDFVTLNFTASAKNQYAYMLEGFDDTLRYVGNEQSATYTNLNPGTYTFKVIASNNDGVWNKTGTSIIVKVLPPWYKTGWAYVLYVLLIIFVVVLVRNSAIKKEKLKNQLALEKLELENTRELTKKSFEVEQMKVRFFTNISHEFRTPLTLIIGPVQEMLADKNLSSYATKLNLMLRNGQRLLRLINQLMDISKLEIEKMQLSVSKNNIVEFINDIYSSFIPFAEQRGIDYKISIGNQPPETWFDTDKIEKIVFNLLSNAFKFTPNNGVIILDIQFVENNIQLQVKDNGVGIVKENLEFIFDRFYQAKNSENAHHQSGTGIGLALVKSLAELHHGNVSVHSIEKEGTTFTVTFPINKEEYHAVEISEESIEPSILNSLESSPLLNVKNNEDDLNQSTNDDGKNKKLILIVEDNEDVRVYLKEIFKKEYRVEEATDGVLGLIQANLLFPDIIISDVTMPNMDGITFCQQLKTDEKISHIPLILLTARASEEFQLKGYETGADAYITKPFNAELLQVRVKNLIESRKKLRSLFSSEPSAEILEIAPTSSDEKFLKRTLEIIEKNIAKEDFDAESLAREVGVGRTVLYSKIKALTEQTVHEFIKIVRLKKAAHLLTTSDVSVKEVVYLVGFKHHTHFTQCFKEHFGVTPSKYANKKAE